MGNTFTMTPTATPPASGTSSGSTTPGATTIGTLTVRDSQGNPTTAAVTINFQLRTPPRINGQFYNVDPFTAGCANNSGGAVSVTLLQSAVYYAWVGAGGTKHRVTTGTATAFALPQELGCL